MKTSTGFTLVEVLVSTLILAIGLLGLAALQASNLRNNQNAYNRSQATQLAYDIADRMRANRSAVGSYLADPTAATCSTNNSPCTACATTVNTCTPAQLATRDLYDWNIALTSTLPMGIGSISLSGSIYTITVSWDENRSGTNDDAGFTMSFQL